MAAASPPSPHADAAQRAFARGDFAQVRALAADFVVQPGDPQQKGRPLFAPNRLVLLASALAAAAIGGAWAYALLSC